MTNSTGYGSSGAHKKLFFNGESDNYELWEIKFISFLRLHKLASTVLDASGVLKDVAPPATLAEANAEVFDYLVQLLDDKSLNLIMRDGRNNGWKSLVILRDHYIGCSKPRIISMWCELTSLKLSINETVTEYVLRAESCSTHLQRAGETVSDSLLISRAI